MDSLRRCKAIVIGLAAAMIILILILNSDPRNKMYAMYPIFGLVALFCIYCFCLRQMNGVPQDAVLIASPEKDEILAELSGLWNLVPIADGQGMMKMGRAFKRAYVTGDKVTFSGGYRNSSHTQTIHLSRTPTGTIYLDKWGSFIEKWDKVEQEMHVNTGAMTLLWSRAKKKNVPRAAVEAVPAVIVLPSWWETSTDPSGRVFYKNNHNMTTSWAPPTAEQIALETKERNVQSFGVEGQPPPAFNTPSHTS